MNKRSKKQERSKYMVKFLFSLTTWSFLTACWGYTWINYYFDITFRPFGYKGNWMVIAAYSVILFVFTNIYGGYRLGYYRKEDLMLSNILALVLTNAITFLQLCMMAASIIEMQPILMLTAIQTVGGIGWILLISKLYTVIFPPRKMLLVYGDDDQARELTNKMMSRSEKYSIHEAISITEGIMAVFNKIDRYETVILCDLPAKTRNRFLKYCFEHSVRTYTTPKISDILIRGATVISLFDTPLLLNRNQGLLSGQRFMKRLVDLLVSGSVLVIASPFILLTAAAVKLYDGGPVFYRQTRLTRNGKEFDVIKFRSMVVGAEKKTGAMLSTQNDSRVTPVGKFIRATRLDELPQLLNILDGDMSLVGPRPERPEIAAKYLEEMPEFNYRLQVKAGLTGYAQVVGRYNTTPYDKLKMDLMYIVNYSLLEDLKLILMTIKIMFIKSSTEGVESPTDKK